MWNIYTTKYHQNCMLVLLLAQSLCSAELSFGGTIDRERLDQMKKDLRVPKIIIAWHGIGPISEYLPQIESICGIGEYLNTSSKFIQVVFLTENINSTYISIHVAGTQEITVNTTSTDKKLKQDVTIALIRAIKKRRDQESFDKDPEIAPVKKSIIRVKSKLKRATNKKQIKKLNNRLAKLKTQCANHKIELQKQLEALNERLKKDTNTDEERKSIEKEIKATKAKLTPPNRGKMKRKELVMLKELRAGKNKM